MMTSTDTVRALRDLTQPGGGLDLGPGPARLLVGMLRLLAREGPVTRDRAGEVVADLGDDHEHVDELLDAWTEGDEDGDIVVLAMDDGLAVARELASALLRYEPASDS